MARPQAADAADTGLLERRGRLAGASPIVPVRRVFASLPFYQEVLGFALADRDADGTYALLRRDGTSLILLDLGDVKALRATAAYLSAYVWVEDAGVYWHEIRPQLDRLPPNRVNPLFAKPDGRHEFQVRDPDGFLLFFGDAFAA